MSDNHLFISHNNADNVAEHAAQRAVRSAIKSHVRRREVNRVKQARRASIEFNVLTASTYGKKRARKLSVCSDPSSVPADLRPQYEAPTSAETSQSEVCSPRTALFEARQDLIQPVLLHLDAKAAELINVITVHHAPAVWPPSFGAEPEDSPKKRAWEEMLSEITGDQIRLAGFLGFGAALKLQLARTGHKSAEEIAMLESDVHRFRALAIAGVIDSITSNEPDLTVLIAVVFLLWLEMHLPDLQAARMHLRALGPIVSTLGGVTSLPHFLCHYVLIASLMAAQRLEEVPPIRLSSWDPGPSGSIEWSAADPILATAVSESLASCVYMRLNLPNFCHEQVDALMTDLRDVLAIDELYRQRTESAQWHFEMSHLVQLRLRSVQCRLYRVSSSHSRLLPPAVMSVSAEIGPPPMTDVYTSLMNPAVTGISDPVSLLLRNTLLAIGAGFCSGMDGSAACPAVYQEWQAWLIYCIKALYTIYQHDVYSSPWPASSRLETATSPEISYSDQSRDDGKFTTLDFEIALWAALCALIAFSREYQDYQQGQIIEQIRRSVRQLMFSLHVTDSEHVLGIFKRLIWHGRSMDAALKDILTSLD